MVNVPYCHDCNNFEFECSCPETVARKSEARADSAARAEPPAVQPQVYEDVAIDDGKYVVHVSRTGMSYVSRHGIRRDGAIRNLEYGLACEVLELRQTIAKFKRLLNPVWMSMVENTMAGEPVADDRFIFTFMGSGASDNSTFGEFREVMGDERKVVAELEAGQ